MKNRPSQFLTYTLYSRHFPYSPSYSTSSLQQHQSFSTSSIPCSFFKNNGRPSESKSLRKDHWHCDRKNGGQNYPLEASLGWHKCKTRRASQCPNRETLQGGKRSAYLSLGVQFREMVNLQAGPKQKAFRLKRESGGSPFFSGNGLIRRRKVCGQMRKSKQGQFPSFAFIAFLMPNKSKAWRENCPKSKARWNLTR